MAARRTWELPISSLHFLGHTDAPGLWVLFEFRSLCFRSQCSYPASHHLVHKYTVYTLICCPGLSIHSKTNNCMPGSWFCDASSLWCGLGSSSRSLKLHTDHVHFVSLETFFEWYLYTKFNILDNIKPSTQKPFKNMFNGILFVLF